MCQLSLHLPALLDYPTHHTATTILEMDPSHRLLTHSLRISLHSYVHNLEQLLLPLFLFPPKRKYTYLHNEFT